MRIINANAELLENTDNLYNMIERAGRTCYKSEDNITNESSTRFVKMMTKNKHTAMLEHAWVHFTCSSYLTYYLLEMIPTEQLKYLQIDDGIISGSLRSFLELLENDKEYKRSEMKILATILIEKFPEIFGQFKEDYYISMPEEGIISYAKDDIVKLTSVEGECVMLYTSNQFSKYCKDPDILFKHLPHTIKFICDRGVSHEFVRHRPASFAQESTRYCNYAKDKFNNEITVIKPCYYEENSAEYKLWKKSCENSENTYFSLLALNSTAQQARSVLPNSLKTEVIITATEAEWQHIVNLRLIGTTGAPHPQMIEVMRIAGNILNKTSESRIKIK